MPRYTITESVGSRVENVDTFRDLEKHHPSSGREPGRNYATIDGELEEIRRTNDGRTLIKKDFILSRDDGGRVDIPAPVAGYIHYLPDDPTNAVRIYDRPFGEPGARFLAQSLHMQRGTSPPEGSRIEYGQPMGRMGDTGSPGSIHAHVEAEHAQFTRYIADIDAGRIAPGVWPARGNAPAPGAPTPAGAMADGVLRQGETGPEVRSLQQRLNQLGMRDARGQPLGVDGDFGERTREAVERFQRSRGIGVDGVVGRDTFRELGEAVREQAGRPAPGAPTAPGAGGTLQPSRLSNLIGSGEGGYNSYNRGVAGDAGGRQIDFAQMTVGEIMRRQDLPRNDPDRLFAVGKFQIIPGTMEETVRALGIDRNARFTPELQERMFHDYLIDEKRPAVRAFITAPDGQGTPALQQRAQIALAQEFASVADPRTGRSYYDGDSAGNASSITARQSAEALAAMRAEYRAAIARGASPEEAWRSLGTGEARRAEAPALAPAVAAGGERQPHAPQRSVLTGRETPLLTAADHPDRALMQQARAGVDRLPPGLFATDREREQAAAALVFEARIAGLARIDAVIPNVTGSGVFAVQGRPDDPGAQRIYVDRSQAESQTVEQSTQMLRQAMPAAPAPVAAPDAALDENRRAVGLRGMA